MTGPLPRCSLPRLAWAVLVWVALGGCGEPAADAAAAPGRLPEFRLRSLDGGEADSARVAGGPLLINVWATWCEPCRREMAGLQGLNERFAGLRVIGITVDRDLNLAREFLLREGIRFPNLADPERAYVGEVLGIRAFPHTLIVGRDGTVLASVAGARDWTAGPAQAELARQLALK